MCCFTISVIFMISQQRHQPLRGASLLGYAAIMVVGDDRAGCGGKTVLQKRLQCENPPPAAAARKGIMSYVGVSFFSCNIWKRRMQ